MTKASATGLIREIANAPPPRVPAHQNLRAEALSMLKAEHLIEPAYHYRIAPLQEHDGPEFKVDEILLHAPILRPRFGRLTALAFGAITLGEQIHARIGELFDQGKPELALMLDDIAGDLLMGLSRRVQDRMMADALRQHLIMSGELHTGDPGFGPDIQRAVLHLAGGDEIGITIAPDGLLSPTKSASMVFGAGEKLPGTSWRRCDACPSRTRCKFG